MGLTEKVTSEQRLGGFDCVTQAAFWSKGVQGNGQCNDSEVGACLAFLRKRKEASLLRIE